MNTEQAYDAAHQIDNAIDKALTEFEITKDNWQYWQLLHRTISTTLNLIQKQIDYIRLRGEG